MSIEQDRERVRRIARNLLERTRAGEASWKASPKDPFVAIGRLSGEGRPLETDTRFTLSLGSGYYVVIASEDRDHQPPYALSLRRQKGDAEVEALRSRPASRARSQPEKEEIEADNALLKDLYFGARDKALRIGEALDAIERDLGIS
jgi:hypothetical protein